MTMAKGESGFQYENLKEIDKELNFRVNSFEISKVLFNVRETVLYNGLLAPK